MSSVSENASETKPIARHYDAGRRENPGVNAYHSSNNLFLNNLFALRHTQDEDLIHLQGAPGTGNVFRDNLGLRGSREPNPAGDWQSTWENNRIEAEVDLSVLRAWQAPQSLYLHQRERLR